VNIQPTPLKYKGIKDMLLVFQNWCGLLELKIWMYIHRDDSRYLSLFLFVFRGVGCIFTEMIAGAYLYLCLFSGELVVYLQR
jgi:hypothetical protein